MAEPFQVSIEKVLQKLTNQITEQALKIASLEVYIDDLLTVGKEEVVGVENE